MPSWRGWEPETASSITEGVASGDGVCADAEAAVASASSATNKAGQRWPGAGIIESSPETFLMPEHDTSGTTGRGTLACVFRCTVGYSPSIIRPQLFFGGC